eukprot:CAMPEP_0194371006 /NCGR_PEP_ID=MMETSP0174-20130528/19345_1 /TAXON_ID=216777 /ORGANISM="Proboscia alata, Strain PI-D3" /LENGTH=760 /DNA_ID=CAMNT_0039148785 /DNA_START=285 /DNA_END=2567 /DNA_ORIENTATION=-
MERKKWGFSIRSNTSTLLQYKDKSDEVLEEKKKERTDAEIWSKALQILNITKISNESDTQKDEKESSRRSFPLKDMIERNGSTDDKSVAKTRKSNTLRNLINVEALLVASLADTSEDGKLVSGLIENNFSASDTQDETNLTIKEEVVSNLDSGRYQSKVPSNSSLFSVFRSLEKLSFEEFRGFEEILQAMKSDTDNSSKAQPKSTDTDAQKDGYAEIVIDQNIEPTEKLFDNVLRDVTKQIENVIQQTSTLLPPSTFQQLIMKAGEGLGLDGKSGFQTATTALEQMLNTAESVAREKGLDVTSAAKQARETIDLVQFSYDVLNFGYIPEVLDTDAIETEIEFAIDGKIAPAQRHLFKDFNVQRVLADDKVSLLQGALMGQLAGALYSPSTLLSELHSLGQSMVANGTISDVAFTVTDGLVVYNDKGDNNKSVTTISRTITLRGYDASDESVDREGLLNTICTATPVDLSIGGLRAHSGLLGLAREIYPIIIKYIDEMAPSHKLILNGHSIGGSISVLLVMLMIEDRGVDFVIERVLNIFTFGAPPVLSLNDTLSSDVTNTDDVPFSLVNDEYKCSVLNSVGLPASMVRGYVQPWDPIMRLFSEIDPLYPIIGDLGADGMTLYASGPSRTLRPITRAIIEKWEGWPTFRDTFRGTVNQSFAPAGIQYILLPEPVRFITDRIIASNTNVPPIETIIQIPSDQLLSALDFAFPIDAFTISLFPAAIRSFIHHFHPAYGFPIVEFSRGDMDESSSSVPMEDNVI